jgi:hypothetical protein
LQREPITALAEESPSAWAYARLGCLPLLAPGGVPGAGVDGGFAARTIQDKGYRLSLYFPHRVAAYADLLHGCLAQVAQVLGAREGGMRHRDAVLFLASPGAVLPAHFDRHHNVVLQVSGSKDLTVGAFTDPAAERRQLERSFKLRQWMADELPSQVRTFHLEAGEALYIPPYAFHWVEGGPDVSIALSCSFTTPETERTELVHACNARLRRLGLPARPPGPSPRRDRAKAAVFRRARTLRHTLSRWRF